MRMDVGVTTVVLELLDSGGGRSSGTGNLPETGDSECGDMLGLLPVDKVTQDVARESGSGEEATRGETSGVFPSFRRRYSFSARRPSASAEIVIEIFRRDRREPVKLAALREPEGRRNGERPVLPLRL